MNNIIDKNKIYVLERELIKITTDFYISELLFNKSFEDSLVRYAQFLKDISNHYAYTGIAGLYKIFDKNVTTNNIDYVIKHLTDTAKRDIYVTKANEIKKGLKPILERRREVVAHSSQKEDDDYLIFYKTYSKQEYEIIIKPTLENIAILLEQLRKDFGFESSIDHHCVGIENECGYLLESLVQIEKQRGYPIISS
ncbi:MAG: hypothetical protein COU28_04160 [Candidatus Magasanikbacteria bacterium CG10_big_fil_rev_8_21_14_0_10_36_16]|uniref:Uncharacterized protein n=1 Tax=Candidatus Magasanikbacteria bacterium CG10_big_fil_rev_8_21_14_0_10_36_16 TaxID=1974645 RepID=A0A2H0TXL7_9BACT|nr:MAG: hypothetical protein COU28_04160 [Candidatus Magasanikbacteria bacterium CG10_big_fil_rev_8_21_14_0_10_36_16]